MFSGIGGSEVLLIVVFVLVFFGSKRIPEFARAFGKGVAEFRKAMRQMRDEIERETPVEPPKEGPKPAG